MPAYFSKDTFKFLIELKHNNSKLWFQEQKHRYEDFVKEPALAFITDFAPALKKISPAFNAIPKVSGGSLFRIYNDPRFAKNRPPYKTHIGIHFRHQAGKDAHAPGFYLHIEPGNTFLGAGLWRPDTDTANLIRARIDSKSSDWKKILKAQTFSKNFELRGDALKRPPRGFDKEHPQLEDLKRKDFIALGNIDDKLIFDAKLKTKTALLFKHASPLVEFICKATGVAF